MTDEHIVFLLHMTTALFLLILVTIVIVSSVEKTQHANEITEELSEVSKVKTMTWWLFFVPCQGSALPLSYTPEAASYKGFRG